MSKFKLKINVNLLQLVGFALTVSKHYKKIYNV